MSRSAMKIDRIRRRAPLVALVALTVALGITSAGVAAPNPTPAPDPGRFTPAVLPLGMSNQSTTVVVQLAADPVTVVDADAATPMTDGQKQQLRSQLKSQQAPVAQQVQSRGGQVLASYQSSYDGLKVRIRADQARSLSSLPGVIAVHPLQVMEPSNIHGVPLVGAPQVWDGLAGFHGEGIKIGVIDSGIDFTHADFAGPGTAAAYQTAFGQDTSDPMLTTVCMTPSLTPCFGPAAPKVKGGTDLVGDAYNADPNSPLYNPVPVPDANPLDCFGHGSHVSGTAAGFGVTSAGTTYTGRYNATTVSGNTWNVGPGVAPKADLYAIKVFGCEGSTDATIDGIEWAVTHGMDVINLSLGSPFGSPTDPAAEAATNAARAGVIVVASTGNEGSSPYLSNSPASGTGAISVAANDPTQANPGANLALGTGTLQAINANGATFADGTTLPVKVLFSGPGTISSGCNPAEYAGAAGKLVVVRRVVGTCARVARAIFGQQAGAAAVLMVNNADGFPPFEGQITANPDTGIPYSVTIPFLGVPASSGAALIAADGTSATLTNTTLSNPGFLSLASFGSFGPRSGDSWLKPDITAPGVGIASVGMGTGNASAVMSGTSMAVPSTAGVAALVKQAHPSWRRVRYWKAAVVNTGDPSMVGGYVAAGAGTGLVQALPAVQTQVVALGDRDAPALNFGFAELDRDFAQRDSVTLMNFGNSPATFTVSSQLDAGSPHSIVLRDTQVTVRPHDSRDVRVELHVPAASAGAASDPAGSFHDVSGLVTFTPVGGSNNGVTLRVPYYLVPQAVSHVSTQLDIARLLKKGSTTATTTNRRGAIAGNADWYSWGLSDRRDHGLASDDLRAAGVQSLYPVGIPLLVFAVNTTKRWSNAAQNEFDVVVDVNNDGTPDYDIVAADLGALTTGTVNGIVGIGVFNLATGSGSINYLADAPTDSNTMTLPVDFSQLCDPGSPCLSAANPRFTYTVQSFGLTDNTSDTIDATAQFNAFAPSLSTGMFDTVTPNASVTEPVTLDPAEWARTPSLGLMVVTHDNPSGQDEAQLISVGKSQH